jgi:hypothetical protein
MNITIEELKRLKNIMDQLEACAELVGKAYYGGYNASVYDIEEDGFNVTIYLPREGEEREFVQWDEFLSDSWSQTLLNKIKRREEAQRVNAAKRIADKEEQELQLYIKLKQKFES